MEREDPTAVTDSGHHDIRVQLIPSHLGRRCVSNLCSASGIEVQRACHTQGTCSVRSYVRPPWFCRTTLSSLARSVPADQRQLSVNFWGHSSFVQFVSLASFGGNGMDPQSLGVF